MRITLIGYGRMGKTVERVAREHSHEIVHTMDIDDNPMSTGFQGEWVEKTDVVIDFSMADAVLSNVENSVKARLPIVVGTTGWYDQLDQVQSLVENHQGACLYSSNFNVGTLILFSLAREAGKFFSRFAEFRPYILEMHHAQKVDAPSGTALSLLKILKESYQEDIPVSSVRAGTLPGTHLIGFDSPVDTLTLEHTVRSRDGFAVGALFAGKWIQDRKGFYEFQDIIFDQIHD